MSYDLFVFEPKESLKDRATFLEWYDQQTNWSKGIDYSDPREASPAIRAWYREMIVSFPPINGPDRPPLEDMDGPAADYCIGQEFIYVAFSGGVGRYEAVFQLAAKYRLGFFDASGDGAVWFPSLTGQLEMVHARREDDRPGRTKLMIDQLVARDGEEWVEGPVEAIHRSLELMKQGKPVPVFRHKPLGKPDGTT
jgi:hypothetical protein